MRINIVVAMSRNGVIGRAGTLPWQLPADLKRFREITLSHPLIMGRVTHESIGRLLPGRRNIVVTHTPAAIAAGCVVVDSFAAALEAAAPAAEVMVVGGRAIYAAALPLATRIFLTEVDAVIDGDVFFPEFARAHWRETASESHPADTRHAYSFKFVVLEKTG